MSNHGVGSSHRQLLGASPIEIFACAPKRVCHFPSLLLIRQTQGLPSCTAGIRAKGCNPLPAVTPARATLSCCRHNCVKLLPSQKKASPCPSAISSVPGFENEHLLLRTEAAQICWQHQHLHGCSQASPHVPRVCPSIHVSFAAQTGGWGQQAAKGTWRSCGMHHVPVWETWIHSKLPGKGLSLLHFKLQNYPPSLPSPKQVGSPASWSTRSTTCCTNHFHPSAGTSRFQGFP